MAFTFDGATGAGQTLGERDVDSRDWQEDESNNYDRHRSNEVEETRGGWLDNDDIEES